MGLMSETPGDGLVFQCISQAFWPVVYFLYNSDGEPQKTRLEGTWLAEFTVKK